MDSALATLAFLSLAGVVAVLHASRLLTQAQAEFQSRLRNAALARARKLLLAALLVWSGAGVLAAFGTPKAADAAARRPPAAAPAPPGAAVQLQLDDEINFTGR